MSPPETNEAAVAWERFCEELKQAGHALLRETTPQDPLTQAEGLRYLARHLHGFLGNWALAA